MDTEVIKPRKRTRPVFVPALRIDCNFPSLHKDIPDPTTLGCVSRPILAPSCREAAADGFPVFPFSLGGPSRLDSHTRQREEKLLAFSPARSFAEAVASPSLKPSVLCPRRRLLRGGGQGSMLSVSGERGFLVGRSEGYLYLP